MRESLGKNLCFQKVVAEVSSLAKVDVIMLCRRSR